MIPDGYTLKDVENGTVVTTTNLVGRTVSLTINQSYSTMYQCFTKYTDNTMLVQDAFPMLTSMEREFILTGSTQEDWDLMFPPNEEED